MKKIVIVLAAFMLLASCRDAGKGSGAENEREKAVVEEMSDIDRMANLEKIVSDSSLMDAEGEQSWHPLNDRLIRIRNGNRHYLRMIRKDGETITNVTYKYETGGKNDKE